MHKRRDRWRKEERTEEERENRLGEEPNAGRGRLLCLDKDRAAA